jgi:hypothetical protein
MNGLSTKRPGILMILLFFISSVSFSQIDNFDFLKAGPVDGVAITQAYITPWVNAFGAGVNGSWYNTAKPHKLLGFDLTFGLNVGLVPSSANTFDASKIGLKTFTANSGTSPTISGKDVSGQTLTGPTVSGVPPVTFKTPPGLNWGYMPVPTLQLGLGLPLGTEVKIRYIPRVNIGNGDISSWGVGLLHSIIQYLPGDKLLPFDVSLFGGYQKLTGNAPIDLPPGTPQFYTTYNPLTSFDNQNAKIVVEALNIGVIGSLNLPVISFYGGLGYAKTSSVINMTGNFPLPTTNPAKSLTGPVYEDAGVLKNFPTIDIKNFSGMRANIGFRLKFAVVTIHFDYTRAQYSVFSTGFGLSFR